MENKTTPEQQTHEWDVFISHASEDKDAVARPLAQGLTARGLRVWYDEFSLKVGDSLRQKIEYGLAHSRLGVVILSPNFFAKHWAQQELNGLATREVDGEKVILPVWHRVNHKAVRAYSPMLADRIAAKTEDGLERVIEKLVDVILSSAEDSNISNAEAAQYIRSLEILVEARTDQLHSAMQELDGFRDGVLETLSEAMELKGADTIGHRRRVTAFLIAIARAMNVPREQIRVLARGAYLHDVGKVGVPDSILHKKEPLTADELNILRRHCQKGYVLLKKSSLLTDIAELVYSHEEHYDGSGFPRGLKGKSIPLGARIFAVADMLDVLTSESRNNPRQSFASARDTIIRNSGTIFDPDVVGIFAQMPLAVFEDLRNGIDSHQNAFGEMSE